MGNEGKVVIRRTIHDSYGFRFSSPFQYLRRMAEFSGQVLVAAVSFLGVSLKKRGNGVIWTVQPYIEGTHPTQTELVADLRLHGWRPAGSLHNHLVFEHAPTGIRMHDFHAGNFIRRKNGDLIPIRIESIPGTNHLGRIGILTRTHKRSEAASRALTQQGIAHLTVEQFDFPPQP